MSTIIKDFILGCVVESDYTTLASLKTQEGGVLDTIYMSLSRDLRAAENMLGRDTLGYAYTDAHRKTMFELARVFGTVHVFKGVSNFILPNDKQLVQYFLNNGGFTKFCSLELRRLAMSAAVCGQTEVVHTIVDWMIENLGKRDLAEDIYLIYEVSTDPWVFRKLYDTGLLLTVLNDAEIGKIEVLPKLMEEIDSLQELEKIRFLTAFCRRRAKRVKK